jgi:hypothetical protein
VSVRRFPGSPGGVSEYEVERETILELLAKQDPGKTICPSDAARALDEKGFRALMPAIRSAASELVAEGRIVVTQRGELVDVDEAKGPIRLRLNR